MKKFFIALVLLLAGCAAGTGGVDTQAPMFSGNGEKNAFNPYMNSSLPNMKQSSAEGERMLGELGATMQSIEGEAAHRKNWREEIYPIVYGDKNAPNEIIVVLDFANPESEIDWNAVVAASKSLSPANCKIVVFGKSSENYGMELMGLAVWLSHSRPGQAMPYLTYALNRWNEVKAAQKSSGQVKKFNHEYDSTASAKDFPIHYSYLNSLRIPGNQELQITRYCYNAGNVNMYQANQVCQYYGVKSLPAVIVNGRVLGNVSSQAILAALN